MSFKIGLNLLARQGRMKLRLSCAADLCTPAKLIQLRNRKSACVLKRAWNFNKKRPYRRLHVSLFQTRSCNVNLYTVAYYLLLPNSTCGSNKLHISSTHRSVVTHTHTSCVISHCCLQPSFNSNLI